MPSWKSIWLEAAQQEVRYDYDVVRLGGADGLDMTDREDDLGNLPGTGQGSLPFSTSRLLSDLKYTIEVLSIAALQALFIPAVNIFIEKYIPSAFRTALKSPHLAIGPFHLENQAKRRGAITLLLFQLRPH